MRTALAGWMVLSASVIACVSTPPAGGLGDSPTLHPTITAVDSALPPRSVWVRMDQPGYAAVLLVAPGHSATLLYPFDSLTNNQLTAGDHRLTFTIPEQLVANDSLLLAQRTAARQRADTGNIRSRSRARPAVTPIPPMVPTFLMFVTSPQPLSYRRILEKTAGVSIPVLESEALNAVGKAIKSTLASEPREWAGYYQRVELTRPR